MQSFLRNCKGFSRENKNYMSEHNCFAKQFSVSWGMHNFYNIHLEALKEFRETKKQKAINVHSNIH